MSLTSIWELSIAAQLLAFLVGMLGRRGVRRTPLLMVWLGLQITTSLVLLSVNAAGAHLWYLDLWRLKQFVVMIPGVTLVTLEALRSA